MAGNKAAGDMPKMPSGSSVEIRGKVFDGNDPAWPEKLKESLAETLQIKEGGGRKKPRVKNTPEDQAVADKAYGIAADELRQFIEQFEQLAAEKADAADRQKAVMAEAKARGYDTKIIRQIIALRRRSPDDIAEETAILDMYKTALGME